MCYLLPEPKRKKLLSTSKFVPQKTGNLEGIFAGVQYNTLTLFKKNKIYHMARTAPCAVSL